MPEPIDAAGIPGANLRPDMVDIAATEMTGIGDRVGTQAATVVSTWQRLSAHYEAPEDTTLFRVMDPVKTNGETFDANIGQVSAALHIYAAEVEPIKAELARIKADAENFLVDIAGGVEKRTFTRAGVVTSTVDWHEDQDYIDANKTLRSRVAAQLVLLWAAERKCANAIYDIIGFPHIEAASESNPNGYGVESIPEGVETPWGKPVERTEACGEKFVTDTLWEGVAVGSIWGGAQAVGSLVLGYNPHTGEWFRRDVYKAAWSNLGMLAVGLAIPPSAAPLVATMPGAPGDFLRRGQQTVLTTGKALIAYDKWDDDPWTAAGEAGFNIVTILVPAAAATTAVRTSASVAAAALRTTAKAMRVVDLPGAVVDLGIAGARVAVPAVRDVVRSLDFSLGGRGFPIEIPTLGKTDVRVQSPRAEVDVPVRTPDHPTPDTLPTRDVGPGYVRDESIRGNPVDPTYGQPRRSSGRLQDWQVPPKLAEVPAHVRGLVDDTYARYGRDATGQPYSRRDFEVRYLNAERDYVYPGNDGAVVDRRYDFSSAQEFTARFGADLDRMGGVRGEFLSFPRTPFEGRGLAGSSLTSPYLNLRLTGDLPPHLRIEVSEVEPALGRQGAGLQVRIIDVTDPRAVRALSVDELRSEGVLEIVGDSTRPAGPSGQLLVPEPPRIHVASPPIPYPEMAVGRNAAGLSIARDPAIESVRITTPHDGSIRITPSGMAVAEQRITPVHLPTPFPENAIHTRPSGLPYVERHVEGFEPVRPMTPHVERPVEGFQPVRPMTPEQSRSLALFVLLKGSGVNLSMEAVKDAVNLLNEARITGEEVEFQNLSEGVREALRTLPEAIQQELVDAGVISDRIEDRQPTAPTR